VKKKELWKERQHVSSTWPLGSHGSATDRSKNGLGKSVDDITQHLSTPADCQIDKKGGDFSAPPSTKAT
jgi:hypothetical protein